MTINEVIGMSHLVILSGAVLLLLVVISFYRNAALVMALAAGALFAGFISLFITVTGETGSTLLYFDGFARFYSGLIMLSTAAVAIISHGYFKGKEGVREEFYLLLVLAAVGASVLAASRHFASLFLGLEILSVSLYALISYLRSRTPGVEAGIKYLILAAASSAFILFGVALIYAGTGLMDFSSLSREGGRYFYPAVALMAVGFGFKLAAVPFHLWTPDVYQGAPAPVTAFIATVSKGAMLAALLRVFYTAGFHQHALLMLMFSVTAAATMFAGNLLALGQKNVKRMLAYSSISHVGYVLLALIAGDGATAVAFYLVTYAAAVLGAFGTVAVLSTDRGDADSIDDYRGLFWKRPWLAAAFSLSVLSLAGVPLTGGFVAKYYIALTGIRSGLWALVIILLLNSVISVYYYLKIIAAMYGPAPAATEPPETRRGDPVSWTVIAAAAMVLLWTGIYPRILLDFIGALL